ncbi:MAG TPA: hypothetical protein DD723_02425 [Candidatus Omnitrophica bacterium]|nr:MAG: hypothetical protein A2Z81_01855 [Omnitrophica WOR_2 bacterium GWA2_45_18]HBR14383.1 hypothetical protein [Candidatus Omnitrophota bacterium]
MLICGTQYNIAPFLEVAINNEFEGAIVVFQPDAPGGRFIAFCAARDMGLSTGFLGQGRARAVRRSRINRNFPSTMGLISCFEKIGSRGVLGGPIQ